MSDQRHLHSSFQLVSQTGTNAAGQAEPGCADRSSATHTLTHTQLKLHQQTNFREVEEEISDSVVCFFFLMNSSTNSSQESSKLTRLSRLTVRAKVRHHLDANDAKWSRTERHINCCTRLGIIFSFFFLSFSIPDSLSSEEDNAAADSQSPAHQNEQINRKIPTGRDEGPQPAGGSSKRWLHRVGSSAFRLGSHHDDHHERLQLCLCILLHSPLPFAQ